MLAEKIAFENGRISNFKGLVTLILNRVILHTVVHHSSTSTFVPNFIEIDATFCGRTYVCTYAQTDGWILETGFIRLTQKSRPNNIGRCVQMGLHDDDDNDDDNIDALN